MISGPVLHYVPVYGSVLSHYYNDKTELTTCGKVFNWNNWDTLPFLVMGENDQESGYCQICLSNIVEWNKRQVIESQEKTDHERLAAACYAARINPIVLSRKFDSKD